MSDRGLRARLRGALPDAPFRAPPKWRQRAPADPARLVRFASFLDRHFYYERIVHFFKYSRALARVTGRPPEVVLRSPTFDALLPAIVLGSRESAAAVADVAVAHVSSGRRDGIPYLGDLLTYERAMMVAEAGPRVWRETGNGGGGMGEGTAPELVEGTVLLDLSYDLPAVVPRLLGAGTEGPPAPATPTKLLVAR